MWVYESMSLASLFPSLGNFHQVAQQTLQSRAHGSITVLLGQVGLEPQPCCTPVPRFVAGLVGYKWKTTSEKQPVSSTWVAPLMAPQLVWPSTRIKRDPHHSWSAQLLLFNFWQCNSSPKPGLSGSSRLGNVPHSSNIALRSGWRPKHPKPRLLTSQWQTPGFQPCYLAKADHNGWG